MKLNSISIENYKIFRGRTNVAFPEDGSPVVFIGKNGSGKSSIIDAIIGTLWDFHHQIQGKTRTFTDKRLSPQAVNKFTTKGSAEVTLTWELDGVTDLKAAFVLYETKESKPKIKQDKRLGQIIYELRGNVSFYEGQTQLPVLVYYPVERAMAKVKFQNRDIQLKKNQFDSYIGGLDASIDYAEFLNWFKNTEDWENEIRLTKDVSFQDMGLVAVRESILKFLDGYTGMRVRRVGDPTLILLKGDIEFELDTLSHGERGLLTLVGDLARRMVIANAGAKTS